MPKIIANMAACQGYANCVVAADDTFDLDDSGIVVLLRSAISESDRARIEQAVHSCPASALKLEDD